MDVKITEMVIIQSRSISFFKAKKTGNNFLSFQGKNPRNDFHLNESQGSFQELSFMKLNQKRHWLLLARFDATLTFLQVCNYNYN